MHSAKKRRQFPTLSICVHPLSAHHQRADREKRQRSDSRHCHTGAGGGVFRIGSFRAAFLHTVCLGLGNRRCSGFCCASRFRGFGLLLQIGKSYSAVPFSTKRA